MNGLTRQGCVTIDEASDPGAWRDAIRWMVGGRPLPEHDAAAFAFEQSANDEPWIAAPVARIDAPRCQFNRWAS